MDDLNIANQELALEERRCTLQQTLPLTAPLVIAAPLISCVLCIFTCDSGTLELEALKAPYLRAIAFRLNAYFSRVLKGTSRSAPNRVICKASPNP